MKSLASLAACCAIGLPVAFGETFIYTWDGTSESYGDGRVAVGYAGDAVATLTAKVAEGDTVVFEGETPVSFAADATVKVDGRGSLTFSNDVAAAGALVFTSDAPRLAFTYPNSEYPGGDMSDIAPGNPEVLAFRGVTNLSEYVFADASGGYYYSPSHPVNDRDFYFCGRTETTLHAQIQYWDGGTCRCVMPQVVAREDGLWLTNSAAWSVKWDATGIDFTTLEGRQNEDYSVIAFELIAERKDGRRQVTFANGLTLGGKVTVAGGVNLRGSAKAFKTSDGETFDADIEFDNGDLTYLDVGAFTNAARYTGKYGDIYYRTPDIEAGVSTFLYEDAEIIDGEMGIPTENLVILRKTNLATITGLTSRAQWNVYNNKGPDVAPNLTYPPPGEFAGDLPAMYFEVDPSFGTMAVARFQTPRNLTYDLTMSIPLVFEQVGRDVAVRKVQGRWVWAAHETTGHSLDPWTWDPWKYPGTNPKDYTTQEFFVTNLCLRLSRPSGGFAGEITFAGTENTRLVNTHFAPGRNASYSVNLTTYKAIATDLRSTVYIADGVTVRLMAPEDDWSQGMFGASSICPRFVVAKGGRVLTLRQKMNSVGQYIELQGGEYGFMRSPVTPSYANDGKLTCTRYDTDAELWNYIGHYTLSDGARLYGQRPRIGTSYVTKPTVKVIGEQPCRANGFYVITTSSAQITLTLDVADVTGDSAADFLTGKLEKSDPNLVSITKTGAGTVLFEKPNVTTGAPFVVKDGTVSMGCDNCFADTTFSLEGGSLAVAAGTANTLESIAISADTTLTLGDDATLTVTDPTAEWATDATVNIVGDPEKCALKFGDESGSLSPRQIRRIRWNGEKCHLTEDGTVVPGALGMMLLFR